MLERSFSHDEQLRRVRDRDRRKREVQVIY